MHRDKYRIAEAEKEIVVDTYAMKDDVDETRIDPNRIFLLLYLRPFQGKFAIKCIVVMTVLVSI